MFLLRDKSFVQPISIMPIRALHLSTNAFLLTKILELTNWVRIASRKIALGQICHKRKFRLALQWIELSYLKVF